MAAPGGDPTNTNDNDSYSHGQAKLPWLLHRHVPKRGQTRRVRLIVRCAADEAFFLRARVLVRRAPGVAARFVRRVPRVAILVFLGLRLRRDATRPPAADFAEAAFRGDLAGLVERIVLLDFVDFATRCGLELRASFARLARAASGGSDVSIPRS